MSDRHATNTAAHQERVSTAQHSPRTLSRALTAGAAALVAAALTLTGITPAAAADAPTTVTVTGSLIVIQPEVPTDGANQPETTTFLIQTADGQLVPVEGDSIPAESSTGDSIDVTAQPSAAVLTLADINTTGTIDATSVDGQKLVDAAGTLDVPLVAATAKVTAAPETTVEGAHTIDIAVITDGDGIAADVPDPYLTNLVGKASAFWSEQTNGAVPAINLNTITRYPTDIDPCDPEALWPEAAAHFNHTLDFYYTPFSTSHLLVISPGVVCESGNGLGSVGDGLDGGITWGSLGGLNGEYAGAGSMDESVVLHELGHNFSLGHSNLEECDYPNFDGDRSTSTGDRQYGNGCYEAPYADTYDVMGYSNRACDNITCWSNANAPALNLSWKYRLGVLEDGAAQILTAGETATSAVFTIGGASDLSGLRGLDVNDPVTGEDYYIEYRNAQGRDAGALYANDPELGVGVHIMKTGIDYTSSVGLPDRTETTSQLSWQTGRTFTSRTGLVNVTVLNLTSTAATLYVTVGEQLPTITGSAPTIAGSTSVGSTITAAAAADWTPAADRIDWQWFRNGAAIAGATNPQYMIVAADAGTTLTVNAIATTVGHTATTFTGTVTVPAPQDFPWKTLPTISGAAQVGTKLTANPASTFPTGTTFTYQWLRSNVAIPGATANTYTVASADLNKTMRVTVTASAAGYITSGRTTAATGTVVPAPPLPFAGNELPTISGEQFITRTLKANLRSTWLPAATTYTYQWYRNGAAIPKATAATYVVTTADNGKKLYVRVTAVKAGYVTKMRQSALTATITPLHAFAKTGVATVTGTRKVGYTVTGHVGAWAPATGVTYTYQWYREAAPIAGATKSTYKQVAADAGKRIRVRVVAAKTGYVAKASVSTLTVAKTVR